MAKLHALGDELHIDDAARRELEIEDAAAGFSRSSSARMSATSPRTFALSKAVVSTRRIAP
jgi:hypothetical protein